MGTVPQSSLEEISGFVLAGGLSSRLGQDKVLLPWNGRTLLEHAVDRLHAVCRMVRVCADRKDLASNSDESVPLIPDALAGAGPLAGIVAALEQSQTPWNFFLAVDLPLVPVELLEALAARARSVHAVISERLCILPQAEGLPQPLCGLYHRSLRDGLRGALKEGKYKIMLALREATLGVEWRLPPRAASALGAGEYPALGTPASGVELFDAQAFACTEMRESVLPSSDWFLNINTPQDWQRAKELSRL